VAELAFVDVYLVRHAIAERRDPVRWPDDSVRPLTVDGIERFRRAARGLRRIVPAVDLVLASPYARAWHTAEILRDEAGWPTREPCSALEAVKQPAAGLESLQRYGDDSSVALVGHKPYLSSLASLLLAGDEAAVALELKKGGVARLSLDGAARPESALLRWSISPKVLRLLAG
jgi:phosphohistidine phosphatase